MNKDDLEKQIIAALRARNVAGETYDHIAKSSRIAQSYIHGLANYKYSPLKLSLEKLFALFPQAEIRLDHAACPASSGDRSEADALRMELQRAELEHGRRELELERRIFELEKRLSELTAPARRSPFTPDGLGPAPYHEPSLSSQSSK